MLIAAERAIGIIPAIVIVLVVLAAYVAVKYMAKWRRESRYVQPPMGKTTVCPTRLPQFYDQDEHA